MRILLTRNATHNRLMRSEIENMFFHVAPKIFAAPLLEQVAISDAVDSLHNLLVGQSIDDVIFISPSAVQFGFDSVNELVELPRFFAVGRGTANLLMKLQAKKNVIFPQTDVGSLALLNLPELQNIQQRKILIVTGAQGKPLLENTLIERAAEVYCWECYQRQKPVELSRQLNQSLQTGIDYVFLHSSHAALHFLEELPQSVETQFISAIVGAETIAEELQNNGWLGKIQIADSPMPVDMLSKLKTVAL